MPNDHWARNKIHEVAGRLLRSDDSRLRECFGGEVLETVRCPFTGLFIGGGHWLCLNRGAAITQQNYLESQTLAIRGRRGTVKRG